MKQRLTKRRVTEAIRESLGYLAGAADALGCTPVELDWYIRRYNLAGEVLDATIHGRVVLVQQAERVVIGAMYDGNTDAAIALLQVYHPKWRSASALHSDTDTNTAEADAQRGRRGRRVFGFAAMVRREADE